MRNDPQRQRGNGLEIFDRKVTKLSRQEFNTILALTGSEISLGPGCPQHGSLEAFGVECHPIQRNWRIVRDDTAIEITNRFDASNFDDVTCRSK